MHVLATELEAPQWHASQNQANVWSNVLIPIGLTPSRARAHSGLHAFK